MERIHFRTSSSNMDSKPIMDPDEVGILQSLMPAVRWTVLIAIMNIRTLRTSLRNLLKKVNPKDSDEINLAIIKILNAEAQRLSRIIRSSAAISNRRSTLAENLRDVEATVPASSISPALKSPGPASESHIAFTNENLTGVSQGTPFVPENVTKQIRQEMQKVAESIKNAQNIIVFAGAGISTNCGIPVGSNSSIEPPLNNELGLPIRSGSSQDTKRAF